MHRAVARLAVVAALLSTRLLSPAFAQQGAEATAIEAARRKLEFRSTVDGSTQYAYLIRGERGVFPLGRPLVVSLHTWSGDGEQRNRQLESAVWREGWHYLFPDFRGANTRPDACGSPKAQQDIIDAIQAVMQREQVDARRIYLTGVSGGGHMTMLMVGRYPRVWAAASAWVGISDLKRWRDLHAGKRYGQMCEACCGGPPGASATVDAEYRARSPITHLHRAVSTPLDISAGVHDGHQGSVPIEHSLRAFNVIAETAGEPLITASEMDQLSRVHGRLDAPRDGDAGFDATFRRAFYLRRRAAKARVTIFEGGHEGIATGAVAWLERYRRDSEPDFRPAARVSND